MIPYYILAIEDETDRAYMTALFFQYQKLMYSTIQKVTNDHWLIDDIFQRFQPQLWKPLQQSWHTPKMPPPDIR